MMKTAVMFLIALALVSPMAIANPQGQNAGGQQVQTTQEVGTQQQTQNQGEEQNLTVQNRERARNVTELHQMIQERKMEMNQSLQNMSNIQQHIYMNQNTVREAVHAFLAMENLTGGIGPNVSQIAREFNNSVQATIMAEEKIQTRSQFARFFMGGDKDAAGEIENETNRNQERIQNLNQLMNVCNCSQEIKAVIQEQIQNIEQEQERLQQLAQNEKRYNGLFGWLFN